jgi:hypothetical protein
LQDFLAVGIAMRYRPPGAITDRYRKYRPPINRVGIRCLAGLSSSI